MRLGMCRLDRWLVLIDDLRAYDFDGGFIPGYLGKLEADGWKRVDCGNAVSPHGGLYEDTCGTVDRQFRLVDASGMVAHLVCRSVQSGFTGENGFKRLFEYPPYVGQTPPSSDIKEAPIQDRRKQRPGPPAVDAVIDFGDVDVDRLGGLAEEERLDPVAARRVEFDSSHAAMLTDRFMLFTGPYVEDAQLRVVLQVAQRLMFARIADTAMERAVELSGGVEPMPEVSRLAANLRLSYMSLVCRPHWRPGLEAILDGVYATERDYHTAREAVDAVVEACHARSLKEKRRLAVSMDVLTVVVSVVTIIQAFATVSLCKAIVEAMVLACCAAVVVWLSRRAR